MGETSTVPLPYPICGTDLKLSVTTNKNGKHAIGVHCPQDGRHSRGFINHRPFVEGALDRLLAAEATATPALAAGTAPARRDEAHQKSSGEPAPSRAPGNGGPGERRPGRPGDGDDRPRAPDVAGRPLALALKGGDVSARSMSDASREGVENSWLQSATHEIPIPRPSATRSGA